ncbi:MAG: MATE family efflux transporter [Treponema sp.]|nr:MATE family efflux transporter [Treponema sp.]
MPNTKNPLLAGFYKTLFSIAIPIILQNLLQTFVNMLDTIMVGRLGAVSIAAVGLGNQIYFMLNMVVFGISSGCSIFIAQFWGAWDFKGIRKAFGIMLTLCFTVSLVFLAGGTLIPEKLLHLYSTDAAVLHEGTRYLRIAALCYPLLAISFSCQMAFRSTEHVVLPMVTTAISFVMNVSLNAIFIFGCAPLGIPRMGVVGAALATVISRAVEMIITLSVGIARKYEAVGTLKELFGFDRTFVLKLLRIGTPVLLSETLWGLGITTQNSIFAHAGTDSFAAFSIMNTVSQLTWVFFIGMGSASSVILGKKIGANEEAAARAYTNRFCWFFPLMGGIIGLLLFPISRILPFVFNVEPHIIAITQSMLYVLMVMYPFRAFNMLIIVGVCRSGGDTIFASIIDNGWMWAIALPLGLVATFVWKSPAWVILFCLESEQVLKSLCGVIRVRSGKWLHNIT